LAGGGLNPAGAACFSAGRGLATAKTAGCPPLFLTYKDLSALAAVMCCTW